MFHHRLRQVIVLLQIEPEVWTIAKEPRQPKRRIRAYGAPPMHNLPNARGRHTDLQCQLILADTQRLEELLKQHDAGMGRRGLEVPTGSGSRTWHDSYSRRANCHP